MLMVVVCLLRWDPGNQKALLIYTAKSTAETARTSPKRLVSPCTLMATSLSAFICSPLFEMGVCYVIVHACLSLTFDQTLVFDLQYSSPLMNTCGRTPRLLFSV